MSGSSLDLELIPLAVARHFGLFHEVSLYKGLGHRLWEREFHAVFLAWFQLSPQEHSHVTHELYDLSSSQAVREV